MVKVITGLTCRLYCTAFEPSDTYIRYSHPLRQSQHLRILQPLNISSSRCYTFFKHKLDSCVCVYEWRTYGICGLKLFCTCCMVSTLNEKGTSRGLLHKI